MMPRRLATPPRRIAARCAARRCRPLAGARLRRWRPGALRGRRSRRSRGGSPNADDIDTLYKIALYVAILIFLLVEGIADLLAGQVPRTAAAARAGPDPRQHAARARLDDRRGGDPRRAHGRHLHLPGRHQEPAGVGPRRARAGEGAAVRVDRPAARRPGGAGRSTSSVNGQQYLWRYDYPGNDADLQLLRHGRADQHDRHARRSPPPTCIHSWWIPKLGGKADARAGPHERDLVQDHQGRASYEGQCAELCGEGHADMRARDRACRRTSTSAGRERQAADIEESQAPRDPAQARGAGQPQ